jgi:hypothetical protein
MGNHVQRCDRTTPADTIAMNAVEGLLAALSNGKTEATSDSIAHLMEKLAEAASTMSPVAAGALLKNGAVKRMLGFVDQFVQLADLTAGDQEVRNQQAQVLTANIEEFALNLVAKAMSGTPSKVGPTIQKDPAGSVSVGWITSAGLPPNMAIAMDIEEVSISVALPQTGGGPDDKRTVVVIFYPQSNSTESLFPASRANQAELGDAQLSSPVVSVSLDGGGGSTIDVTLSLDVGGDNTDGTGIHQCAWWDYDAVYKDESVGFGAVAKNTTGGWSTDGCTVIDASNARSRRTGELTTKVTCKCNHMTHFAALFSTAERTASRSEGETKALNALTYIGLTLGDIGILLAWFAFATHRHLVERPEKIVAHLTIAIAIGTTMFVAGTGRKPNQGASSCKAVAGILHYLLLAAWTWQLCEAEHLYHTFVVVMGQAKNFNWYLLIGWGSPLLFVVPSMLAFPDDYGGAGVNNTNQLCWIQPSSNANYFFIVPALLGLLVNCIVCIVVLRSIEEHAHALDAKARTLAILTFGVTTGLIYLFGALQQMTQEFVFEVFFSIGLGVQGLLIFYFHVYRKEAFRASFVKILDSSSGGSGANRKGTLNLKGKRGSSTRKNLNRSGANTSSHVVSIAPIAEDNYQAADYLEVGIAEEDGRASTTKHNPVFDGGEEGGGGASTTMLDPVVVDEGEGEIVLGFDVSSEAVVAEMVHAFKPHTYLTPTFCHQCKHLLAGVYHQGVKCHECHWNVHEKCVADLPPAACVPVSYEAAQEFLKTFLHDGEKPANKKKRKSKSDAVGASDAAATSKLKLKVAPTKALDIGAINRALEATTKSKEKEARAARKKEENSMQRKNAHEFQLGKALRSVHDTSHDKM